MKKIKVRKRSLQDWQESNSYGFQGAQTTLTRESLDELPELEPDEEYERI